MNNIEKIEKLLEETYSITDKPCPRTYIFPDGKFLQLSPYISHNDVKYTLMDQFGYSKEEAQLENYGVIRINMDSEGFIALSKIPPTSAQYKSLRKEFEQCWRPWAWRYDKFMIIEPERDSQGYYLKSGFHYYSTGKDRYSDDEFIDIIKYYYETGKIVESLKKTKSQA